MRRPFGLFVGFSSILLLSGCFSLKKPIDPPTSPAPSVDAARATVRTSLEQSRYWLDKKGEFHKCCATRSEVQLQSHGGSYVSTTPEGSKVVRLTFDKPIETYDQFRGSFVCLMPFAYLGGYKGDTFTGFATSDQLYFTKSREDFMRFVHAYNALVAYKKEHGEDEFNELAREWREANPKPPLSENGDKNRILAENAFREKNVEKAVRHFEAALETDPTWPDGNFNLALLYGETNEYGLAAFYMKRYLTLVPDSKDAKAARQKLIIWEDKAQSKK